MIQLAWPKSGLNPNSRTHWAAKAKLTRAYRGDACWATKAAGVKIEWDGKIDLHIFFAPPDKRRRDMDGMLSSIKAGLDGVADGLGVNDHRFRLHLDIVEPVKGGAVNILVNGTNA